MEHDHSAGYSSPHWKPDDSPIIGTPDHTGSIRVPAKALNIIWGNDPRYWQWIKLVEEETGGFEDGAVLLQVNWIQVTGKVFLKAARPTTYEICYVVKFRADAFGWHSVPIKFKVKFNKKETQKSLILESYREKNDIWHEIPGGEFSVSGDSDGGVVEFCMFEVDSEWWKGSMVLAGIKMKPKAAG